MMRGAAMLRVTDRHWRLRLAPRIPTADGMAAHRKLDRGGLAFHGQHLVAPRNKIGGTLWGRS